MKATPFASMSDDWPENGWNAERSSAMANAVIAMRTSAVIAAAAESKASKVVIRCDTARSTDWRASVQAPQEPSICCNFSKALKFESSIVDDVEVEEDDEDRDVEGADEAGARLDKGPDDPLSFLTEPKIAMTDTGPPGGAPPGGAPPNLTVARTEPSKAGANIDAPSSMSSDSSFPSASIEMNEV